MKCVCPMGKDRTCPDDCPLAIWNDLKPEDRKTQRKPIAERLYKQGFTMEAIATQLGVSVQTISTDLKFSSDLKIKKPAKTKTNPKGAGRPKGSSKPRKSPTTTGDDLVMGDSGLSARDAQPLITPDMLSMTAQQKLEAAKRVMEKHLNAEHAARMQGLDEEVRQRVLKEGAEYLADLRKLREKADRDAKWYRELINDHRPPLTVDEYKTILMCLHPDGERTAAKLHEAFVLLEKKREILTGQKRTAVA